MTVLAYKSDRATLLFRFVEKNSTYAHNWKKQNVAALLLLLAGTALKSSLEGKNIQHSEEQRGAKHIQDSFIDVA